MAIPGWTNLLAFRLPVVGLALLSLCPLGCSREATTVRRTATAVTVQKQAVAEPPPAKAGGGGGVFQPVQRGDLIVTLRERGTLEAVQAAEVLCRVRGKGPNKVASTIKWLVEDGTSVKKGDRLVELDDSALQEELKKQDTAVAEKQATLAQAETALKVAEITSQTEMLTAEGNLELAVSGLKKHEDGTTGQRRKLEIKVQQAKLAVELVHLRGDDKKPAGAAKLAERVAEGDLEIAEIDLKNYLDGLPGEKRKLEMQLQQAKSALEIARLQTAGRKTQAESQVQAAKLLLETDKAKLHELKEDIGRCVITAPGDGVVVYYVPEQVRFGAGAQAVVAQGEPVREGQRLMRVTDLRQMQVRTMVHEAFVARLRPAKEGDNTSRGQSVLVRVDAFPNRAHGGHLRSVANVASQQDWLSADVKVYPSIVALDETIPGLKPGMSADVTILLDERKNVLRLPVQAVVTEGREKYCYVKKGNDVEKRKLTTGASNDLHVEIKEGLKEGEEVLLNPRARTPGKEGKGPATSKEQSQRQGTADIIVRSVKPAEDGAGGRRSFIATYGLTHQDYERLQTIGTVTRIVPERIFPQEVRHREWLHNGRVVATRQEYSEISKLELAAGRFLVDEDDAEMKNVAVLGFAAAKKLYPDEDPLGQTVNLGSHRYVVVGVIKERLPAVRGKVVEDFNGDIYIPLQTCRVRFGERIFIRQAGARRGEAVQLSQVLVTVREASQVRATAEVITSQLERFHSQKDWEVQVSGERGGEG